MDSSIHSIAIWAAERLSVVQAIDPAAFESMRGSLGDLMAALKGGSTALLAMLPVVGAVS